MLFGRERICVVVAGRDGGCRAKGASADAEDPPDCGIAHGLAEIRPRN